MQMTPITNENFIRLIEVVKGMGDEAGRRASDTDEYKAFIAAFPVTRLPLLTADEYCLGKGDATFCRWIERGLVPALGRYMPGTSRGHIVYFRKDDKSFYKNRHLQGLSDDEALRYTLKIQAAIAAADISQDITWIDDDAEVFRRAGVEPRVTVGHGRKLRLLACYHPEDMLPISSSEHVGHFLDALGCPQSDVPDIDRPVARMLKLREYYALAKESVPILSTRGFMRALYSPELGIAPVSEKDEPDDPIDDEDGPASAYLLTWNPEHIKLGGNDGDVVGTEQRWTCHSKQPKVGDTVYLIRLGVEPRGIVARGVVTEGSHEAPHWKDPSRSARYIRFRVDQFRPDAASGLLPMVLLNLAVPEQEWSPQRSGIGLPEPVEKRLRALWDAGADLHSLRQYVDWSTHDPTARQDDWIDPYREIVTMARSLRDAPSRIDEHALDDLWRIPRNGVTSVGSGALSHKEFADNKPLLIELTRAILARPTAETLADAEDRWQQAVADKTLSKMRRAVIRRVFSAASPESFTTLLRENDCQKVLALFKRQFELSPSPSAGTEWAGLNADIVASMKLAALDPERMIENNTAVWRLVEYLSPPAKPETIEPVIDPIGLVPTTRAWPVSPTNLVLYGPPGTGKTHNTIDEAIAILAPELLEGEPDRSALKARFDRFVADGQIVFTTFHQSFSYEDFVEGLRADTDETGQLRYRVVDGIFKRLCNVSRKAGETPGPPLRDSVFRAGETFSGNQVERSTADVLELTKPNGNHLQFGMRLLTDLAALVRDGRITTDDIRDKQVFKKVTDSKLEPNLVNGYANILPLLVERLASTARPKPGSDAARQGTAPRVLIIDEINRGNVSRIFGELITLIEPSKRAGMPEALTVTLPYSKESFDVPANLHIIATMNTADRSLVGLDIALRRRFEFREVSPRPDLLDDVFVEGLPVGSLLRVMNERIELLLDRDHCLGHAYFLPLRKTPTLDRLARIFKANVLPLLQEYFFEDWQRIRWVLNDHRKPAPLQFVSVPELNLDRLFGGGVGVNEQSVRWLVNDHAFLQPEAYSGVIATAT